MLIIRRSNCIIQHLVSSHTVGGRPVCRLFQVIAVLKRDIDMFLFDAFM